MKKIYTLSLALLALALLNSASAQTYNAIRSGNWSNAITWDPNSIPSATCNNCTINIGANLTVTLDAAVVLTGTSRIVLNTNAVLVIPGSSTNANAPHNSITMVQSTPGPSIQLLTGASINATATRTYDGIFSRITIFGIPINYKLVGTPVLFFPAVVGTTVTGPATLSSNGTLPVILTDFNAVLDKGAVDVTWTTQTEINADHFSVERSADGANWSSIGTVAAAGNSVSVLNYSFTDNAPLASVNYYRLQNVDRDGKFTYTEVKVVRGSLIKGFSIFPNPASDNVYVTLSSAATKDITLRLINQAGQVLQEKKVSNAAGTTVSLPVRAYPSGTYMLQIKTTDGVQQTSKLLITRK